MWNVVGSNGQQSVLINGSAGGVGSAAVQIAKRLGARVTAVCSTKDVVQVQKWGADTVIDRTKDPKFLRTLLLQQKETTRFDVILDAPNRLSSSATGLLQLQGGTIVNTVPTLTMVIGKLKTMLSSTKSVTSVHAAPRMPTSNWWVSGWRRATWRFPLIPSTRSTT